MSYDVSLDIADCDCVDHSWNYTSNLSRVWDDAGVPLRDLEDAPASEVGQKCRAAIDVIRRDIGKYREWEPGNGWGDCEGAIRFLENIAKMCENHPDARLRVWR